MTQHYLQRELYERIQSDPQLFDFLQASSLDGLWYWDLENPEHEWMNADFWRLFGIDPATRTHRAAEWKDIIFREDLDRALENFRRHLVDPSQPYDQIVRYRHADGSTITVRCRGIALFDRAGKPVRMLGAHTDLTSLKETEARLEAANRELAQQVVLARAAALAKDAFLSSMSHEVRTPLNAVLGFFQLLQASDLPERQKDWAGKGIEAAEGLMATLSDVLDASELDAARIRARVAPVHLDDIARQIEAVLAGSIAKSGKALGSQVTCAPGLGDQVVVDRLRLTQITNNLIDNAVKFTREGAITVSLEGDATDAETFRIVIRDTGIGIAPADQSRIFGCFARVNDGVTREYGGLGLGLSISRDLAVLMGGMLTVESDGRTGTCFTLSLPRCGHGSEAGS